MLNAHLLSPVHAPFSNVTYTTSDVLMHVEITSAVIKYAQSIIEPRSLSHVQCRGLLETLPYSLNWPFGVVNLSAQIMCDFGSLSLLIRLAWTKSTKLLFTLIVFACNTLLFAALLATEVTFICYKSIKK